MTKFVSAIATWEGVPLTAFPHVAPPCGGVGHPEMDRTLAAAFAVLCSGSYPTTAAKAAHLQNVIRVHAKRYQVVFRLRDADPVFRQGIVALVSTLQQWKRELVSPAPAYSRAA